MEAKEESTKEKYEQVTLRKSSRYRWEDERGGGRRKPFFCDQKENQRRESQKRARRQLKRNKERFYSGEPQKAERKVRENQVVLETGKPTDKEYGKVVTKPMLRVGSREAGQSREIRGGSKKKL